MITSDDQRNDHQERKPSLRRAQPNCESTHPTPALEHVESKPRGAGFGIRRNIPLTDGVPVPGPPRGAGRRAAPRMGSGGASGGPSPPPALKGRPARGSPAQAAPAPARRGRCPPASGGAAPG
eukprot:1190322-Prorocentrum_minimum.AAC.1